jgi:hypothetical protein
MPYYHGITCFYILQICYILNNLKKQCKYETCSSFLWYVLSGKNCYFLILVCRCQSVFLHTPWMTSQTTCSNSIEPYVAFHLCQLPKQVPVPTVPCMLGKIHLLEYYYILTTVNERETEVDRFCEFDYVNNSRTCCHIYHPLCILTVHARFHLYLCFWIHVSADIRWWLQNQKHGIMLQTEWGWKGQDVRHTWLTVIQGGSNMTGTICV